MHKTPCAVAMLDVALLARGKSAPEISPVRLMLGEGFRLIVLNHGRERPLQAVILDASNKAAENFGAWLISPHKGVKALGAGLTSDTRLNCSAASTMGAARMNVRYRVELSQAERGELKALLTGGKHAVRKVKRAQVLR